MARPKTEPLIVTAEFTKLPTRTKSRREWTLSGWGQPFASAWQANKDAPVCLLLAGIGDITEHRSIEDAIEAARLQLLEHTARQAQALGLDEAGGRPAS
jgi:hypothetical protein